MSNNTSLNNIKIKLISKSYHYIIIVYNLKATIDKALHVFHCEYVENEICISLPVDAQRFEICMQINIEALLK